MLKVKTTFFCQSCGAQYSKWQGQCNACKSWNTIVEEVVQNPTKYEGCINYLGDLYSGQSSSMGVNNDKDLANEVTSSSVSAEKTPKWKYVDRYSY